MIEPGEIVTFYSYKGGVGRSMALANIGCILAKRANETGGRGVLLVDWDLEAPGLHRFFQGRHTTVKRPVDDREFQQRLGLIDLFVELRRMIKKLAKVAEEPSPDLDNSLRESIHLEDFIFEVGSTICI